MISKNSTDTEIHSQFDDKNTDIPKLKLIKVLDELHWKKVVGVVVIDKSIVVISTDCKLILAYDMKKNFNLLH